MEASIEQQHVTFARARQAALPMSRSASLTGRAQTRGTQHPAQGFAAQGKAFHFHQLLAEMVVVEARVTSASQMQDAGAHAIREAARAGLPAAGVCQSRCACLPITKIEALHVPWRNVEQLRGSGTRQVSLYTG